MLVDKMWIKILAWWIVDKDDSHPVFQGPDSHIGDLSQRWRSCTSTTRTTPATQGWKSQTIDLIDNIKSRNLNTTQQQNQQSTTNCRRNRWWQWQREPTCYFVSCMRSSYFDLQHKSKNLMVCLCHSTLPAMKQLSYSHCNDLTKLYDTLDHAWCPCKCRSTWFNHFPK